MKLIRGKSKRFFAMLLMIVLVFTSIQTTPVKADTANSDQQNQIIFTGEGFDVLFQVTSQWDGAFNADVTIKNTSDKVIDNWAVEFQMPYEITNIWNGIVESCENGKYVIKNAGSNQDIGIGQSVNFGFSANSEGTLVLPDKYSLLSNEEELSEKGFEIDFRVISDWTSAFNGEISIKNVSETTIEDWKLEFDYDGTIERFWTAEILDHTDNHYVIKNAGYNANIKSGETIVLGFSANPGNVATQPENYKMSHFTAEIKEEPVVVDEDQTFDRDDDKLTDIEEKKYGTNPEKPDTDGDGLTDYEEVQLGLNPIDIYTNGELDADHKTMQVLSDKQIDINKIENNYECTVSVHGVGLASERLSVIPTMNVNLNDSEFMLGNMIDIDYAGNYDKASISMKISEANIDNTNSPYAKSTDELKGIRRFQIFKLDTMQPGMYPIETTYDNETNTISANVDGFGTFCIIDLEKWLDSLGIAPDKIELEDEKIDKTTLYSSNYINDSTIATASSNELENILANKSDGSVITAPTYDLDIVYLVNNSQMVDVKETKEQLKSLTRMLYNTNNYNVRVGVTTYCCYLCSSAKGLITYKSDNNIWADNASDAIGMINQMQQDSNQHQTHLDGLGAVMDTYKFRPNAKRILVHVVNNGTEYTSNRYGISDVKDAAKKMDKLELREVLVAGGRYVDDFKVLYSETNGIYSSIVGPYVSDTYRYINYLFGTMNGFRILNPVSLRYITLDAFPSNGNYLAHSDEDGYADYQEIDWKHIKNDGQTLIFPTMREYLQVLNVKYGELFKRLGESYSDRLDSILVLPVKCDPTLKDTDGDFIDDDKDSDPLVYNCREVKEGKNNLYVGSYKHCMVKFKPEYEQYYDLYSTTDEDTVIEVYTKNWLGKYEYLYTDDNSGTDRNFKLTKYLKRGTNYYIKLYHKLTWKSDTIDLNINTHTDRITNGQGGSWVNVGSRTYGNSFVLKTVYLPADLVSDLYDNVSMDEYKKYRALVVQAGITAAITYLTGKAGTAVLSKATALGLPAKVKLSSDGISVLSAVLTMKMAPDLWQMELDSIKDASNTFRNGVKISSMSIPRVNASGIMTYEMLNVYEKWDGTVMEGEIGQLGKFTIKDYTTLWK